MIYLSIKPRVDAPLSLVITASAPVADVANTLTPYLNPKMQNSYLIFIDLADGVNGFCNADGCITLLMPHPERVFLSQQLSWHPQTMDRYSPWMRMFHNAYHYLEVLGEKSRGVSSSFSSSFASA